MSRPIEYRDITAAATDPESGGFSGYASTWWAADSYRTAMAPSAFTKSLQERGDRIPLLYQHNPDENIGVPAVLRTDERGLYHESRIFDDGALGTVLLKRLRQGARFGMSFGFQQLADRAASDADPLDLKQHPGLTRADVRVITEVKLYEISLVTFPANESAAITEVRTDLRAQALAQTLEELRAGSISESDRALIAQLVAAFKDWQSQSPAAPQPETDARTDPEAANDRARYLAFIARRMGITPESLLCVP